MKFGGVVFSRSKVSLILLLLLILIYGCSPDGDDSVSPGDQVDPEPESWSLDILLALSGSLSSTTQADSVAVVMAAEDLAEGLIPGIDPVEITPRFHDTQGDPVIAADLAASRSIGDPPIIIGPSSSEEASALLQEASASDFLLLSPTATAPSLAIDQDNLFRLSPDDRLQVSALVKTLRLRQVDQILIVHRNDTYGSDFADVLQDTLAGYGIALIETLPYSPDDINPTALMDTMETLAQEMFFSPTRDVPGIVMVGYSELVDLLGIGSEYFWLPLIQWYATDGLTGDPLLLADSAAADFACQVSLLSGSFIAEETQRYLNAELRLRERSNRTPSPTSLLAYDAVILTAMARQTLGQDEPVSVYRDSLITFADRVTPVCGDCSMNEAGDRRDANFGFFSVVENTPGEFEWVLSIRQ